VSEEAPHDPQVTRRDVLGMASVAAFFCALGATLLCMLRLVRPSVMPERSTRYKIGSPGRFPPGTVRAFPEDQFVVFSDDEGLHAISLICTHLGCVVHWEDTGFACPCHGSKFDAVGKVTGGPAPKALPWLKIDQLPNGRLSVDTSAHVPPGTKFYV